MSNDRSVRRPISTRHAFALAFDLAVRRDFLQSIAIPLLLHSPWLLALALLPSLNESERAVQVFLVRNIALLGDFGVQLVIAAMLRFRARSVFNTPADVRPAPAA